MTKKQSQLLDDIIDAASNGELVVAMNKALTFALLTENIKLSQWIQHELGGYLETNNAYIENPVERVPNYRKIVGDYLNENGIKLRQIYRDLDEFNFYVIRDGIAELVHMANNSEMLSISGNAQAFSHISTLTRVNIKEFVFPANQLKSILQEITNKLIIEITTIQKSKIMHNKNTTENQDIFIVHGHDELLKTQVARFLETLGLKPNILHEQANKGGTIIEKLEHYSSNVGFAIVLITADDLGKKKTDSELRPRARQNVIFELGYFMALLKRNKVAALLEEGVEEPSDIKGIVYTPIDSRGAWKLELAKELESAGYEIDLNKLIKK